MNDDELRALIRAAIQKHIGSAPLSPPPLASCSASFGETPRRQRSASISFGQYRLERAAGRHDVPDRAGGAVQSLRFL